jgi:hypothetical protein
VGEDIRLQNIFFMCLIGSAHLTSSSTHAIVRRPNDYTKAQGVIVPRYMEALTCPFVGGESEAKLMSETFFFYCHFHFILRNRNYTEKTHHRGGGDESAIIKPMSLTAAAAAAQNGREMKYNFRFLWSGRFPKP